MRAWIEIAVKLLHAAFFFLTSLYCGLAYIPYTFSFLIQAPPYDWISWFARYHVYLFWLVSAAYLSIVARMWSRRVLIACTSMHVLLGLSFSLLLPLAQLKSNSIAYALALVALVPIAFEFTAELSKDRILVSNDPNRAYFGYGNVFLIAVSAVVLSTLGLFLKRYWLGERLVLGASEFDLIIWALISAAALALMIAAVLNCLQSGVRTFAKGKYVPRRILVGLLGLVILRTAFLQFVQGTLSFQGWPAQLYTLAFSATLSGFIVVALKRAGEVIHRNAFVAALLGGAFIAVSVPALVGHDDWNGILAYAATFVLWGCLGVIAFMFRPRCGVASWTTTAAIVLVSIACLYGMRLSEVVWAKSLGSTDDEIQQSLVERGDEQADFHLIYASLQRDRKEPCGELCLTLRQFTNVPNATITRGISLTSNLERTTEKRPNVFIFVIDDLQRNYLGVYNPRANFTPNIDAFARESIIWKNAYTQYAGTSLSEPAIWTGTLVLHSHYMKPFSITNNLEKLANIDGYQLVVSDDNVLRELLSKSNGAIRLDTDKARWNNFDISSTIEQLEKVVDSRQPSDPPILFYAQPMNVHGAADNRLPKWSRRNWQVSNEFSALTSFQLHQVDSYFGAFLNYLKQKNLYEDSVIFITADHGEGPRGHSAHLDPQVMRVPLIMHLPKSLRGHYVWDEQIVSAPTDITPTLYYLLGHRPLATGPLTGRTLIAETCQELHQGEREDLFLASDSRAAYGLLRNGRYLYVTYDFPTESYLFDLQSDPDGHKNILSRGVQKDSDTRIINYLRDISQAYGYVSTGGATRGDTTWIDRLGDGFR